MSLFILQFWPQGMSVEHPAVGCSCPVCPTWRRIGILLCRPLTTEAFQCFALRRLRELYTELLDAAEGFQVGAAPVAADATPVRGETAEPGPSLSTPGTRPPGVEEGAAAAPPVTPVKTETGEDATGPNHATSKAAPTLPPPLAETEPAKAEVGDKELPNREQATPDIEKKEKTKKDKKAKKDKKSKKPSKQSPARSSRGEEKASSRERGRRRSDKATPASSGRERPSRRSDSRGRRLDKGVSRERERSRRRSRSRRREERRSVRASRRSRGEHRVGRSDSPIRRRGSERPPEPVGPPPFRQGPPVGPPPGQFHPYFWGAPVRYWGGSKGAKRRNRREDIRLHGTDPQRKAARLAREARG